jgi:hypothetical protein
MSLEARPHPRKFPRAAPTAALRVADRSPQRQGQNVSLSRQNHRALSASATGPAREPTMPAHLVRELGQLWAKLILADLKVHPNLASVQAEMAPTVASPSGPDRRGISHPLPAGGDHHPGGERHELGQE